MADAWRKSKEKIGGWLASPARRAAAVVAIFALSVYASAQASVPEKLPGVAMGWEALFHVERAGAMLGAIGVVLLIGWRAMRGEFPIKFGNVEYAAKEAAAEAKEASELQEQRIRVLEVIAGIRKPEELDDGK